MDMLETLFDNSFFQLPLMEGMMYAAVVLLIGAAVIGTWDRLTASRSRTESRDLRKAA